MLLNPRYGIVGLFGMPYYLIFEFLGPIIEVLGYLAFIIALLLGVVNLDLALIFLLVAVGLGGFLSMSAIFLEQLRTNQYQDPLDLTKLILFGFLENFGYRQLNTLWRFLATISFLRAAIARGKTRAKSSTDEGESEDDILQRIPKKDSIDPWETTTERSEAISRRDAAG